MSNAQNKRVLALMRLPENSLCADCHAKDPRWASSKLGVFICINCSGIHRGLGTHITFVRSCTLDTWKQEEVEVMERVGNLKGNQYWEARLPPDFVRPNTEDREAMTKFIRQKYEYKKWIDPLMRPPQIPDNVPWEPEPPQTFSTQFTDEITPNNDNQMPNEMPRRRKKKRNPDNHFNDSTDPYIDNNNNNNMQDSAPPYSPTFTEAKNKMKNNKKKFAPQNNIPIEHENLAPSSDSLMSSGVPYNPGINENNSNISDEDNGFDPFSGKPLSKEKNSKSEEESDNENTIADKILGFIQNGIDFIKEKAKSKKRNKIYNASGKMSENPQIPKQDSLDSLQPHNINRPQFNSFEHQEQYQQHQPPPPPPQYNQYQEQPQQFQQFENGKTSHDDLGKKRPTQQQQASADVFSMLDGSDIIVDDSFNGQNSNTQLMQNEPVASSVSLSATPNSQNPFLNEIAKNSPQQQKQVKNDFNPFLDQNNPSNSPNSNTSNIASANNDNDDLLGLTLTQQDSQQPSQPTILPPSSNDTNDILSLSPESAQSNPQTSPDLFDFQPPPNTDPSSPQANPSSATPTSDLFDLSPPAVPSDQTDLLNFTTPASPQQPSNGSYASDLFDISIPESSQPQEQPPSEEAQPVVRQSAYDVFGRPPARQAALGSLGLTQHQQQIAMRALQGRQQPQQGSGSAFSFGATQASPSQAKKAAQQGSGDPFSGMNPF